MCSAIFVHDPLPIMPTTCVSWASSCQRWFAEVRSAWCSSAKVGTDLNVTLCMQQDQMRACSVCIVRSRRCCAGICISCGTEACSKAHDAMHPVQTPWITSGVHRCLACFVSLVVMLMCGRRPLLVGAVTACQPVCRECHALAVNKCAMLTYFFIVMFARLSPPHKTRL